MAFIAIEGTDGSGKATQTRLLAEAMAREGRSAYIVAFPRYGETVGGKLLGECLAGKRGSFVTLDPRLASIPYSIDRFESSPDIRAALARGDVVIADRFIGSNQIHQGGKMTDETERNEYLAWLDHLEHTVLGIPKPDTTIYLKAPVETSLKLLAEKRAAKGNHLADGENDQVEKDLKYLTQSHDMANWLAERDPSWNVVNCVMNGTAMRSRQDIHREVMQYVRPFLD